MPHAAHYFRRILELRGGERGGDGDESGGAEAPALAAGIEYAHVSSAHAHTAIDAQDDGEDLADLMAQLKSVQ